MNAPAHFTLPFGEQYIRLFGPIPPEQVMTTPSCSNAVGHQNAVDPLCSSQDDGTLGPPHPHSRDPNEGAAGRFSLSELPSTRSRTGDAGTTSAAIGQQDLSEFLAASDHPSAAALADIAALRLHHIDKGHTPESDAEHGPVFFMSAARAWWQRAQGARTAEARRKAMVAAAAIFVAMIDAHDFTTRQQEPTP